MRLLLCRLAVLLFLLMAVHSAVAQSEVKRTHCPKPISFALYEHGVFYDAVSGRGLDKDLVEELAVRTGCRFELVLRSRARIWADLESGQLMMTASAIETDLRREFAWFVHYLSAKNFVVVREALGVNSAQAFENEPKLRWGAVRAYRHGNSSDAFLARLRHQKRVAEEPDLLSVYHSFLRGRTDAFFLQPFLAAKYLEETPSGVTLRIVDWFPDEDPVNSGIALSKAHFSAEDQRYWRKVIDGMRADGTLKRMFSRYLPANQVDAVLRVKSQ